LASGSALEGKKGFGALVRIRLLGGFEVRGDHSPLAFPMGARRLIAFLALNHQPIQRQHLASSLWLDQSEESAQACLRSTLWRIGHQGYPIVHVEDGLVSLAPGVSVDLHEAISLAQELLATSAPMPPLGSGASFVDDLLPGWTDDWLFLDRERFQQRRLHVLEMLSRRWASAGYFAEAVEVALRAIAVDSLRESAHRALVGAHLAEGNFSEGIRCYERFSELLWSELELHPSTRMAELISMARSDPVQVG
jgi:DNA-binding SARP family transcriptional activator